MIQPDDELIDVFQQLGIELLESRFISPEQRTTRKMSELSSEALLSWLRQLGPKAHVTLIDEVRKRKLMSEDELRRWLSDDTLSA
jgi:hypothetical protein